MKLAVDTHHLFLENAGTRRTTTNLIDQFGNMDGIEVVELKPPYKMTPGKGIPGKVLKHLLRFFWVHLHLPILCWYRRVDWLVSPEFNTPMYTGCKRAVIAHDAHIRAQKEYTSSIWFYCYYIPFIELPIRRADVIFTVSHFARKQIVALMKLPEEKVYVAYNGVDGHFQTRDIIDAADDTLSCYGLESRKFILFVGTFETRKNIERLIKAFSLLKKRNAICAGEIKLAIVGKSASGKYSDRSRQIMNLISELGIEEDVVLCGFVPDSRLPDLYSGALFIAFPSLHEGFGLPIIEGFVSKTPVLTSNVCSMPEIAGGAALLVDPYNVEDIAEKTEQLIRDKELRERLVDRGFKRVREFTWERSADTIVSALMLVEGKNGNVYS